MRLWRKSVGVGTVLLSVLSIVGVLLPSPTFAATKPAPSIVKHKNTSMRQYGVNIKQYVLPAKTNIKSSPYLTENQVLFSFQTFLRMHVKPDRQVTGKLASWPWYASEISLAVTGKSNPNALSWAEKSNYISPSWTKNVGVTNQDNRIVYFKLRSAKGAGATPQQTSMVPAKIGWTSTPVVTINGTSAAFSSEWEAMRSVISRVRNWKIATYPGGTIKELQGFFVTKSETDKIVGFVKWDRLHWAWNTIIDQQKMAKASKLIQLNTPHK